MNKKEKQFVNSIIEKITKFSIKITIKEAISLGSGFFVETKYNDGTLELVDARIEWELCARSSLYFISRYGWIPFPGKGVIPYDLYYFQKEILKDTEFFNKLVFLKTRQAGISTLFSLYSFWLGNFHESENIDVISIKQKKAQQFTQKMFPTIDRTPKFLLTPIKNKNTFGITWKNGSTIISESASDKAGRGDSLSLLILDELAFYRSDSLTRGIISAAQPTLTRTGGQQILISTPNGLSGAGSYYAEQVQQLEIVGGQTETDKLIVVDWFEVPDLPGIYPQKGYNTILNSYIKLGYYRNKKIRKKAQQFFKPIAKNYKNNPFLKKQHNDLNEVLYRQEIEHNFIVSGDQVFNEDTLDAVKIQITDPIQENKLGKSRINGLQIWKHPVPKQRYIIGVDVSTGTSGDFSVIEIMDAENYEQVAEYQGQIATKTFGKLVKKIARYYNEAYTVIECNSIGEAVFNEVYYDEKSPYKNLYKEKKSKNGVVRMTGWITTTKSRQLMINNLIDYFTIDELFSALKINSKRLYIEMLSFVWINGKPVHSSSSVHDDTLIAFGLCLYFRNKVTQAGLSFLFDEDGELVGGTEDTSELEDVKLNEDNVFDFVEGSETSFFDTFGVNEEQYKWLLGK